MTKQATTLAMFAVLSSLSFSVGFCQENTEGKPTIASEESVRVGINDRFKATDLSVEEFLRTFEVESREVYAKRNEILKHIQVKPNDNVIDLGAGTGFYAFLFAEEVGPHGKVLALDIAPAFIRSILEKAESNKVKNIEAKVSTDIDFEAEKDHYDLVFLCDVYHHIEYPGRINRRIFESLRSGGRLVVIDFKRIEGVSRQWVLDHVRAGSEVVKREIEQSGLIFKSQNDDLLEENYIMIFQKG